MSVYFNQLRTQLAAKIPRVVSEMAHYHSIQEMELPPKQEKAAQALFCFVEILPPSTLHPVNPDFYAMTFDIEVGHGNKSRLFMMEDGELTEDPALAALVSKSYDRDAQSRAYHRNRAFAGITKAKEIIRTLGVPKGIRIYDNIP
jgi:hypothetical protein